MSKKKPKPRRRRRPVLTRVGPGDPRGPGDLCSVCAQPAPHSDPDIMLGLQWPSAEITEEQRQEAGRHAVDRLNGDEDLPKIELDAYRLTALLYLGDERGEMPLDINDDQALVIGATLMRLGVGWMTMHPWCARGSRN